MITNTRYVERPVFTRGRSVPIDTAVIHQYNDPQNAGTYRNTIDWLFNTAQVSIHYVVSGRSATRMVRESDTAWHAMEANSRSIGVEFDPNNMDYQFAGEFIAWICKRNNIKPSRILSHNQAMVAGTRCPATIDWKRIKKIATQILEGKDDIVIETSRPIFRAGYYLERNKDVARHYNAKNAHLHWLKHGIKEGRASAPNFHVREYLANYADLRRAYGDKGYARAIDHYFRHGINEGRSGRTIKKDPNLAKLTTENDKLKTSLQIANTENKALEKEINTMIATTGEDTEKLNVLGEVLIWLLTRLGLKNKEGEE